MTMVDMDVRVRLVDLARNMALEAVASAALRAVWDRGLAALRDGAVRVEDAARARRDVARVRAASVAERGRVRSMLDRATPPAAMAAAPVAPARGPMQLVSGEVVTELVDKAGSGSVYIKAHSTYWLGMDRLSIMCAQAAAVHRKAGKHFDYFVPPFTREQIAVGRRYAALVESHDAGGMKCANLAGGSGSGKGGDFMDAFVAEGREIEVMRKRLGDGQAMAVRRVRPSVRGTKLGITDRRLVDMVCLGDMDLSAVLDAHGWASFGKSRAALRTALCEALDRMSGLT